MAKPREISFDVSVEDYSVIEQIVVRALLQEEQRGTDPVSDRTTMTMDLVACHVNGNPLRLEALLKANDLDFAHDVYGIRDFIDRRTGKLTRHFSPRYSK